MNGEFETIWMLFYFIIFSSCLKYMSETESLEGLEKEKRNEQNSFIVFNEPLRPDDVDVVLVPCPYDGGEEERAEIEDYWSKQNEKRKAEGRGERYNGTIIGVDGYVYDGKRLSVSLYEIDYKDLLGLWHLRRASPPRNGFTTGFTRTKDGYFVLGTKRKGSRMGTKDVPGGILEKSESHTITAGQDLFQSHQNEIEEELPVSDVAEMELIGIANNQLSIGLVFETQLDVDGMTLQEKFREIEREGEFSELHLINQQQANDFFGSSDEGEYLRFLAPFAD